MTQVLFPPKKPLNFAIKQELLKHLSRTDIYIFENNDTKKSVKSQTVKDFHNEEIIVCTYDKKVGVYTIKYMGEIVAEMDWRNTMFKTREHQDIFEVIEHLDAKAAFLKKIREAMDKMSAVENKVYSLGKRALENARYE